METTEPTSEDSNNTIPKLPPIEEKERDRRKTTGDLNAAQTEQSKSTAGGRNSFPNEVKKKRSFKALGKKVVGVIHWKNRVSPPQEPTVEVVSELPAKPRFGATLSLEAQYAMMKGYEDLLLQYLREHYPERAVMLPRNHTPLSSLKGKETAPFPLSKALPAIHKGDKNPNDDRISEEKRLIITYRFQSAMDILDKVREARGLHVTSPRYKAKNIQPIEQYGLWNNTWKRDFLAVCNDCSKDY